MARASHTVLAHESQCRLKDESGPETVRQHCPGLTHSLDYGKEGLGMQPTQFTSALPNNQVGAVK